MEERLGKDWTDMTETYPPQRRELSRRVFFGRAGAAVAGSFLLPTSPVEAAVKQRRTAKNVVFVLLAGGPSHVDTFDLKEGPWLNDVADGRRVADILKPTWYGDVRFPQGLMPILAEQLGDIALLRSVRSWSLVHEIGRNWIQIGRNPFSRLGRVAPHIGSVVSMELGNPKSGLPAFVCLNTDSAPTQGYLDMRNAPLYFTPESLMCRAADGALRFSPDERNRYGGTADGVGSSFGNSCLAARNLLRAKLGPRFIQVTLDGWDHHSAIYARSGLPAVARQLDSGLGNLIADLRGDGLLDETLIVATGEFGRTAGPLNSSGGRDHFPLQTVLMAGAQIRGKRAIGSTDALGSAVIEPGWSRNREIRPEDIQATIYSALGIDWTTVRTDDPFGRGFAYVPHSDSHDYGPVNELWM